MTASLLVDGVKIVVNSTGTGALTLGAAVPSFRGIEALTNGSQYSYAIQVDGDFEWGTGTYLQTSQTLTRSPLWSSNGGAPLDLPANAQVSFVALAEDLYGPGYATAAQAAAEQTAADRIQTGIDRAQADADAAAVAAAAGNAASGQAVYPNAYASALPQGVTALSGVGTGTGTGGTPGTYNGGVTGGPTGFAWSYTIGSDGKIASYAITNKGVSSSSTAPTLSYPSGSITGATVPVATVSTLIADQQTYWAATADSQYLSLWKNDGGSVAPVNNPDGSQIELPTKAVADLAIGIIGPTGYADGGVVEGFIDATKHLGLYVGEDGKVGLGHYRDVSAALDLFVASRILLNKLLGPIGYADGGSRFAIPDGSGQKLFALNDDAQGVRLAADVLLEMNGGGVLKGMLQPFRGAGVDLIDRAYLDGRSRKKRIVGWGDSLLQNPNATNTVFANMQQLYPGRLWQNSGKAGLTSTQILAQMGAKAAYFTVSGNVIPASGSVALTAIDGYLGNTQQSTQYEGELFGVKGVLTYSTSAGYSFLRTCIGAPVNVPSAAGGIPFTLSGVGHYRDSIVMFSMGRNNLVPPTIIADLKTAVAWLGHDHFGIYSILNTRSEPIGNANYNTVISANQLILNTFGPQHYVPMREDLLAASDPSDQAQGLISLSLLGDGAVHVNDAGAAVNTTTLNTFLSAKGWLNA